MRPIWSGSISFGLVNIPVKLHSGLQDNSPELHLMHKRDGSPIKYSRVCRSDGKEVPLEEIVKGYQWSDGDYVVLEPDDFERASPEKTHTIEIQRFVAVDEINPIYFDKPFYLVPDKAGLKAYALLREALMETKTVGIGQFVLRFRDAVAIIRPFGDLIVLEKLRYADEIRDSSTMNLPKADLVSKEEIKEGVKLIKKMSGDFHPEQYSDSQIENLKKIIAAKVKRHKQTAVKKPKKVKAANDSSIVDIMKLLKDSLKK